MTTLELLLSLQHHRTGLSFCSCSYIHQLSLLPYHGQYDVDYPMYTLYWSASKQHWSDIDHFAGSHQGLIYLFKSSKMRYSTVATESNRG